jgi:C4-type Zn-finger protein
MKRDTCPVCSVGTLKAAGPPFTDTSTSPAERKVLYRCSECGYSEERSAEPLNIDGEE